MNHTQHIVSKPAGMRGCVRFKFYLEDDVKINRGIQILMITPKEELVKIIGVSK